MIRAVLDDDPLLELSDIVDRAFDAVEADYASRGGMMPRQPNLGASGMRLQVNMWNRIIRQLGQWGVATAQSQIAQRRARGPATLRTEQPQVVSGVWRRGRTLARGRTATNHPDIQVEDPRSGRRINIEVDSTYNEPVVLQKLRRIAAQDPQARSAAVVTDPVTGTPVRTHVYNPLTGLMTVHSGGLQRRDVLDLDE